MHDGIRDNTKRTYKAAVKDYIKYCQEYNLETLPASQETLMVYATYLYRRKFHSNSIKVYLFAIRHFHIVNNYSNPLLDNARLQLVLKAVQRKCVKSPDKLPITYDLLKRMYVVLTDNHDHKLMWAAMTLGFFGLLRANHSLTQTFI
jgi:site-specific recombinase XerD